MIRIDDQLFDIYPDIRLGIIQFDAEVKEPDEIFWNYMHDKVIPGVIKDIEGKSWNEIKGIKGSRAAYKAFGRNPGRYRVSSEALIRRIRRGDELYHINNVVDVNNLISIKSGLSVGSYDKDKIKGDIVLRQAFKNEGYTGIGKTFIDMENMLVLSDDEGLFGSSMSDSLRTMVTTEAKKVLVVIYCFEEDIDLEKLIDEGKQAFVDFCNASNIQMDIIGRG